MQTIEQIPTSTRPSLSGGSSSKRKRTSSEVEGEQRKRSSLRTNTGQGMTSGNRRPSGEDSLLRRRTFEAAEELREIMEASAYNRDSDGDGNAGGDDADGDADKSVESAESLASDSDVAADYDDVNKDPESIDASSIFHPIIDHSPLTESRGHRETAAEQTRAFHPATPFAPAWLPMCEQEKYREEVFAHVNCSYLSNARCTPPTLLQLKKHAQSLIAMISSLEPPSLHSDPFDYLDLNVAYTNADEMHNARLPRIANSLVTFTNPVTHKHETDLLCPLHHPVGPTGEIAEDQDDGAVTFEPCNVQRLVAHASDILDHIDHAHATTGGLLSLVPPAESPHRHAFEHSGILAQLLMYAAGLTSRVVDLEVQLASAHAALAGEAVVPNATAFPVSTDPSSGLALVYPQNRFVLANLTPALHGHIASLLDAEHQRLERHEISRSKALRGIVTSPGSSNEALDPIPAVTLASTFYRLPTLPAPANQTIFVVPATGTRPDTSLSRQILERSSIVTVARAPVADIPNPNSTALPPSLDDATPGTVLQRRDLRRARLAERAAVDLDVQLTQIRRDNVRLHDENRELRNDVHKLQHTSAAVHQTLLKRMWHSPPDEDNNEENDYESSLD